MVNIIAIKIAVRLVGIIISRYEHFTTLNIRNKFNHR